MLVTRVPWNVSRVKLDKEDFLKQLKGAGLGYWSSSPVVKRLGHELGYSVSFLS